MRPRLVATWLGLPVAAATPLLSGCGSGPGPGLPPGTGPLWAGVLLAALAIGGAWALKHWDEGAARRTLDRRYARGEIERDAYLQAVDDLEATRTTSCP